MTIRDITFQGSNLVQPRTYEKPSLKASYIVNGINESTLLLAYRIFILYSAFKVHEFKLFSPAITGILVAVGAKDRFNQMIRPYGKVLEFQLNTRERTVFASFRLKGELEASSAAGVRSSNSPQAR